MRDEPKQAVKLSSKGNVNKLMGYVSAENHGKPLDKLPGCHFEGACIMLECLRLGPSDRQLFISKELGEDFWVTTVKWRTNKRVFNEIKCSYLVVSGRVSSFCLVKNAKGSSSNVWL